MSLQERRGDRWRTSSGRMCRCEREGREEGTREVGKGRGHGAGEGRSGREDPEPSYPGGGGGGGLGSHQPRGQGRSAGSPTCPTMRAATGGPAGSPRALPSPRAPPPAALRLAAPQRQRHCARERLGDKGSRQRAARPEACGDRRGPEPPICHQAHGGQVNASHFPAQLLKSLRP
uniref:Mitotic spindle assembly checkpoint protein MAD2B isoform X3 n=1 Tax=Phascolarctos cinereus TaxID=38626 RepID=A0A6P5J5G7_PHACI|nr:mitotic spindle assembly checkpoint protein MAD2B isoform X3 [Phascolarctos cinereus]